MMFTLAVQALSSRLAAGESLLFAAFRKEVKAEFPYRWGLFPLLREDGLLDLCLVVRGRLAHDHEGHPAEVVVAEVRQGLLPLARQQVVPHLHDHIVPAEQRRHRADHLLDVVVVELADAEVHGGPVVAASLVASNLAGEPALEAPPEDAPAAKLGVSRVLLQEAVQPVEGALVGQPHGVERLALPAALRRPRHHGVLITIIITNMITIITNILFLYYY